MKPIHVSGRSRALAVSASAVFLFTAACSHKPVAAKAPPPPAATAPETASNQAPQRALNTPAPVRSAPPAAPNRGMTQADRAALNQSLARLEDALFDYDKATIRPDAMQALQSDVGVIRSMLAKYPQETIKIEGHCDERGSAEYNLALGDRRATATKEFLANLGISGTQLVAVSLGKENPVCTEQTEACWQQNRRAHFVASNDPETH